MVYSVPPHISDIICMCIISALFDIIVPFFVFAPPPPPPNEKACYERVRRVASRRVHRNAYIRQKPPRLCRKGALVALGRVSSDNATKRQNRGGFSRMYAFIL